MDSFGRENKLFSKYGMFGGEKGNDYGIQKISKHERGMAREENG